MSSYYRGAKLNPVKKPNERKNAHLGLYRGLNTQLMEKNHNRLHLASIVALNGVAKTHSCI